VITENVPWKYEYALVSFLLSVSYMAADLEHPMGQADGQSQLSHRLLTWPERIPADQWLIYQRVIEMAQAQGIRFALGGAFALATYTGYWRNTKDLDLYVLPQDRDVMIDLVTRAGLCDYHDQLPYDRGWIYRSVCEGVIVDVIWAMANRRAQVDEAWLTRGPVVSMRGVHVHVVPVEEMIWAKIYILYRERCDWPDVFNMIYTTGTTLDWGYLLDRVGEDVALVRGVLSVFTWLCPGRAQALPSWLWQRLHLPEPQPGAAPEVDRHHVNLLDPRPWFSALLVDDEHAPS
jgi:hypothetical protein